MARLKSFGFEDELEIKQFIPSGTFGVREYSPSSRTGNYRLKCVVTNQNALRVAWQHNPTDIYCALGVLQDGAISDAYPIVQFGTGLAGGEFANLVNVRARTTGAIDVARGATVIATSAVSVFNPIGDWTHVQVWFSPRNTGGRVVVKVDGTTVIDFTGDTTDSNEYCNGVGILNLGSNQNTYFDDFVINDNNGTSNNSWPGMVRLQPIRPMGVGANTGLSRGGVDLGANHRQVNDLADAQSFLQGALNTYDLYSVDVPDLPLGATINNIIVQLSGKTNLGTGVVAPMIRGATTQAQGTDAPLTAAGLAVNQAFPTNPDDNLAWEEADLANLQIGVKIRS